jgi:hypothetical protein
VNDEETSRDTLTEDTVLEFIRLNAGQQAADVFGTRYEPEGGDHPGDRVFVTPVPLPDGRFLGIAWMFGEPSPDEDLSWKARWHALAGPFSYDELIAFAGDLA